MTGALRIVRSVEHPLGEVLRQAAEGVFPPADGGIDVVPPLDGPASLRGGVEAVVALTGHALIATALPRRRLERLGVDGFGGACAPAVLQALAGPDGEVGVLDVLLVAHGTGRTVLTERLDLDDHPRVQHARRWRPDVHVHGDSRGLVTIGTGPGGLPELSFEVVPGRRGHGVGRSLLADGLGLVPAGEPVLAAVSPGNAASLRAVLATGFTPIGSVQLVLPGRSR